jgi:hypothetical protein
VDSERCGRCRKVEPSPGFKTCDSCRKHERFRNERRRHGNPIGDPHLPREQDQQKPPPTPMVTMPAPMRSCAICADFARCHMTKLDVDGPEYPVCVDCNSKPAEVKNDYRGFDIDADVMSGGTRDRIATAYNRIVPASQRGGRW